MIELRPQYCRYRNMKLLPDTDENKKKILSGSIHEIIRLLHKDTENGNMVDDIPIYIADNMNRNSPISPTLYLFFCSLLVNWCDT